MPVKGTYLAVVGGGIILLWSGIKGNSWSEVLRTLIAGKNPASLTPTNAIMGTPASAFSYGQTGQNAAGTATGGTAKVPVVGSSASEKAVMAAICAGVGAPPTPANINSMVAWAAKEAPWDTLPPDGAEYTHNPFNTTLPNGSVGEVNSVGVRIYPNWGVGIASTVATLRGYPNIVALLRSGKGLCGTSAGGDFSKWSGGGYSSVC